MSYSKKNGGGTRTAAFGRPRRDVSVDTSLGALHVVEQISVEMLLPRAGCCLACCTVIGCGNTTAFLPQRIFEKRVCPLAHRKPRTHDVFSNDV